MLRTKIKYESDILNINHKITGIVDNTIFNKLKDFHPIVSGYCDTMHDILEGSASKVMAKIIVHYDEKKIVPINVLNRIMQSKDFDFEGNNIPTNIKIEYLKKKTIN